jgi:hypothetical protein
MIILIASSIFTYDKNNLSARVQQTVVSELIDKELQKGFIYGPFTQPPFDNYRVSPIGVAEGKYSKKKRLILDLFSPHNDTDLSINDLIDKAQCSMSYVKIDDAIKIIMSLGKGSFLCKFDRGADKSSINLFFLEYFPSATPIGLTR